MKKMTLKNVIIIGLLLLGGTSMRGQDVLTDIVKSRNSLVLQADYLNESTDGLNEEIILQTSAYPLAEFHTTGNRFYYGSTFHQDNTFNGNVKVLQGVSIDNTMEIGGIASFNIISNHRNSFLPISIGGENTVEFYTDRTSFLNKDLEDVGNIKFGASSGIEVDNNNLDFTGQFLSFTSTITSFDSVVQLFKNLKFGENATIESEYEDLLIRTGLGNSASVKKKIIFDVDASDNAYAFIDKGHLTAKGVTLDVGSFPDYVFAEDYNLMPLKEVSAYIKANKHLPNVPSEAEVIANGMNVAQINTILVEKVEELTLHTISQEEKIDALTQEMEALKALITASKK